MDDPRYDSNLFGYPKSVKNFCRNLFDNDEISTPDTWGRAVNHTDEEGNTTKKVRQKFGID